MCKIASFLTAMIFLVFFVNAQAQWTKTNFSDGNVGITAFAVMGNKIFAGTAGAGVFRSADSGKSWTQMNNGITNDTITTLAVSANSIFAGTGGGIFRSQDTGAAWIAVNTGLTNLEIHSFAVSNGLLFAGTFSWTEGMVFRSADNGASWDSTGQLPESQTGNYKTVTAIGFNGTTLFSAYYYSVTNPYQHTVCDVSRSTDTGTTWNLTGFPSVQVTSFLMYGSNIFASTYSAGISVSSNNGGSWNLANNGLTNIYTRAIIRSDNNIFVGTHGGGVFISQNDGASWNAVNTGLTDLDCSSLGVSGGFLFAGADSGHIWRRCGMQTGVCKCKIRLAFTLTKATCCDTLFRLMPALR